MTTEPTRIAVIGAGWWATDTHLPSLRQHPYAQVVALGDADPNRLNAAAETYEIAHTYTDHQALLQNEAVDGVVVVSSNASHYEVVRDCLARSVHVMVEKPMTLFAPQARHLVELAREKALHLIVGYPFNYTPYARRAREVVRSGELGPVQMINLVYNSYMTPLFAGVQGWKYAVHGPAQYTRPEQTGGGHGQVQVTHALGLLFHVADLRPQRVMALMRGHQFAVDLVDAMTVAFEGDAIGTVTGSGNFQGLTFRLEIGCETGYVEVDGKAGRTVIHRNDGQPDEVVEDEPRPFPLGHLTGRNLVDVIRGDAENGSTGEVGWRAVEMLDAAYRSAAQEGQAVSVASLYE